MRNKLILPIFIIAFGIFGFSKIDLKNKGYYKVSSSKFETNDSDSTIINGRILDLKLKTSLPYARFEVKDSKIGCLVNDSGYFKIKIKTGTYKFNFACVGNTDLVTKQVKIEAKIKYYFNAYLDSYKIYEGKK
jgi:hypothetical protein